MTFRVEVQFIVPGPAALLARSMLSTTNAITMLIAKLEAASTLFPIAVERARVFVVTETDVKTLTEWQRRDRVRL